MDWSLVVAPVVGLVGVVVGTRLAAGEQGRNWRSDVRLRAYLEVVRTARLVLWRGDEVGSGSPEKEKDAVRDAIFELRQAVTQVALVGPKAIKPITSEVITHYTDDLHDYFMGLHVSPDPHAPEVKRARVLLMDFQMEAEKVLAISRHAR